MTNAQKNPPEVLGDLLPRCKECGEPMQRSNIVPGGMSCIEGCGRIIVDHGGAANLIPDHSPRGRKIAAAADLPLMVWTRRRKQGRRVYLVHGEPCVRYPESTGTFQAVRVTSANSVHIENAKRIEPAQDPVTEDKPGGRHEDDKIPAYISETE